MASKPYWLFTQSGVIPYRETGSGVEILLITTRKRKRLIIPKGVVDPGMTHESSALNEAYEEAGIKGIIVGDALGEYSYEKWGGTCTVRVFVMKVTDTYKIWPESTIRKRSWMSVAEACETVAEPELKRMIASVSDIIRDNAVKLK